jgi:hypothetical protein
MFIRLPILKVSEVSIGADHRMVVVVVVMV